jgi:integrase
LAILRQRHADLGKPRAGLVFPAPRSCQAIDTFSSIKSDLDEHAELAGWRWHDFRRSFATNMGEAGVADSVADAVLNHRQSATRGGVLGVYQRSKRWPDQVAAMKAWDKTLEAALNERFGAV